MELVSYTLDNMIRDERSQKEILDYLNNQSVAVVSITEERSSGLYGYINGEYLDGTGWIPEEGSDYDPLTRPWYAEARAAIGRVAVVDPYIDVETGKLMLALAKTLCDAKSVVTMDVSMDRLQGITEDLVKKGNADMEIVLDRKYQVIANSDSSEVGKNYIEEKKTLGNAIVEALRVADKNYFSVKYQKKEYIVYTTTVANDWICLSVYDASAILGQLKNMLVLTILAAAMIILVQLFIMFRLNKKTLIAQQLNKKAEVALAASEAKSAFLSNMSHEIRTPINAVLGMNEMILRESNEENIITYAQSIHAAGHTLLGLINDILDFSKIEAGKMEILPVEYDISSVINDLVTMIQTKADDKGLILKLDFNEEIPKLLYGDEVRVKQVITNILTNAVKYTDKGSVTFKMDYEKIPEEEEFVYLLVSVKDTGIGIKAEDLGKLFTEFERIEEKRNRNVEGTGLGMNITKRLLDMMGTSLEVQSEYGVGSDFSFRLKQKVTKWEPLGDYEKAYGAAVSGRKKYKEKFTAPDAVILMVDDTPMNLQVFKSLLKNTHVQVDTAERGEESLGMMRRKKYDIVLLDHMMPEMDGIETLNRLRKDEMNLNRETTAICLTADAISGAREKYLDAGFDDYLTKPIDADKLEEMLMHYLPDEKIKLVQADEQKEEVSEGILPVWIWQCEGIDAKTGINNCGGEEEFLSILKLFHTSIDEKADEIETFYNNGDIANYTIKVHALKSSARIIGAEELSEKAQLLEAAGDEGNVGYIKENTEPLLSQFRSYKEKLEPLNAADETLPEIPEELLSDGYEALAEAAVRMDYDLAEMVLDSFKEYRFSPEEKERINKIQIKFNQLDWDGISEIIKEAQSGSS